MNPPAVVFSSTDVFGWTLADIPLDIGSNVIELIGLDSGGQIVDSDTITVTSD